MNVQTKPNLGAAQRRLPFKWQRWPFVRQVVAQRDAGFSFASPCPGRRKQPFTSHYC